MFGPGAHTAALGMRFDATEQASRCYRGRPVHVLMMRDGSVLVSGNLNGAIDWIARERRIGVTGLTVVGCTCLCCKQIRGENVIFYG